MPPMLRLPGRVDPRWSEVPDFCVCTALRMLSRYASRQLDRVLEGHGLALTEFQLMLILWMEGSARTVALARRLRLDPGPTGHSLARLEERGVVNRKLRWRFSEWELESSAVKHFEVLEPLWQDVDRTLRAKLGGVWSPRSSAGSTAFRRGFRERDAAGSTEISAATTGAGQEVTDLGRAFPHGDRFDEARERSVPVPRRPCGTAAAHGP